MKEAKTEYKIIIFVFHNMSDDGSHTEFGIRIIDHLRLLSKNQTSRLKLKIKQYFSEKIYRSIDAKIRFQNALRNEILPSIQYPENSHTKYDHAEIHWDPENRLCTVELLFDSNNKHADNSSQTTRSKIKQILYEKNKTRQISTKSSDTDQWKMYSQIKKLSGRQDVPSPSDIQTNRQIYEEMIKTLPNSPVKQYIEQCL
jgi:hypothetical protein